MRVRRNFALLLAAAAAGASVHQAWAGSRPLRYTVTHSVLARYPLAKESAVDALEWSPDGKSLAVARSDGEVFLLPGGHQLCPGRTEPDFGPVRIGWSPDGQQLAIMEKDLEAVTLKSGHRQSLGPNYLCAAWLAEARREALPQLRAFHLSDWPAGLVGVKGFPPVHGITVIALPLVPMPDEAHPFNALLLNTRGVITTLSPDGQVVVTRLSQTVGFSSYEMADFVVWHVRLRDGRILWRRALGSKLTEYYDYDRAVWSDELQAAAVSYAGATDGASYRRLYLVTRRRVIVYEPTGLETSACLDSDPVWLGRGVLFAECGYVHIEPPHRQPWASLTCFDVPTRRRQVLFTGADEYRAPAVDRSRTKLAFAQLRGDRWEIVVVRVRPGRR